MASTTNATGGRFDHTRLIADPIYHYVEITRSNEKGPGEQELLDNPWLQRVRYIHQLQASWWVFPSAEHSRFVHLLGAMHLAGRMGRQVYESLKLEFPNAPSLPVVEETLRLAGLLHDVGHGPFGHFFDRQVLKKWNLDHEDIGRHLLYSTFAPTIRALHASPSGPFEEGEFVDPDWVAWIMAPAPLGNFEPPGWLAALKPILCGPATVDNMDYVVRDAYMCGVEISVDVDRIIHYSFVRDGSVVLHEHAVPALQGFLQARLQLYTSVYYHRTSKRFELSMKEIYAETFEVMGFGNPLENMDAYLNLTDWSLLETVRQWKRAPENEAQARLGMAWDKIISRDVPWRLAFEMTLHSGRDVSHFAKALRAKVGEKPRFVTDWSNIAVVSKNPMRPDGFVGIWDPLLGAVSPTNAALLSRLPQDGQQMRVFTDRPEDASLLREAARTLLAEG